MDYDSYLIDGKENSEIATDMPCGDGTLCCFPAPCIVSNKSGMSEDRITWEVGNWKLHAALFSWLS